jgi:hypothetical protein
MDAQGAALEQAIGETAGGGSNIDTDPAGGIDVKGIECGFDLEAATAYEPGFFLDLKRGVEGKFGAGFVDRPVARADFASENEALGLLAGIAEATGNEEGVGAFGFHGMEELEAIRIAS